MAIDVVMQDGRGRTLERGDGLFIYDYEVHLGMEGSSCLRWIDPYGDTVFNQVQLPHLVEELRLLAGLVEEQNASRRISDIAGLAVRASARVHTYVKFIGD